MVEFMTKLKRLSKLYKKFPELAAIEAVNFTKERFVRKNWVDRSVEPWEPRKRTKNKKGNRGALMVRSGRLKRSIRKLKVSRNSVTIGTDVPYAESHNDGLEINKVVNIKRHSRKRKGRTSTVKSHSRKMNLKLPERRFMGESALLLRRIERLMEREMKNILQ
ncbi:phage virion morphogenesis protein [Flavobacterium sp. B183]|uniref:phage virion morphogenesis protein n=1 Tax=Flavobacterium sp. B183 TaxID=907046 RepID=UPI00201F0F06|nr:phage virion morphogenesis protein [Flavobacterium sp. B183]URC13959.1 phage virion morphogenesis protein [Flavobacterium sp. B183]URC14020.1 phage virion morphogenesis protein [Flavobacterium sp. B183]